MFVAKLDCSWKNTPFHYQGFEILSESEIEILQRHCKTVYIDPTRVGTVRTLGRHPVVNMDAASTVIEAERQRLFRALSRNEQQDYPPPRKTRKTAREAIATFNDAREATQKLLDAIVADKGVRARHCRGVVEPIVKAVLNNPDTMAWLTFINKSKPRRHDRRISTAIWASIFGRYLGLSLPALVDTACGALLLDIGFLKIAGSLREHEGKFAQRERLAMQSHVRLGEDMLARIPDLPERVLQMQAQHHERLDGSGYPRRLAAEQITPFGSLAALVDCYDAMISDTAYRPALSSADAIKELQKLADKHFPALQVECFVQALGMFPSGSLVELSSGEIAIVVEQDKRHRLRPEVFVVTDEEKNPISRPYRVRLATKSQDARTADALWIDRGHPTGSYGISAKTYFD